MGSEMCIRDSPYTDVALSEPLGPPLSHTNIFIGDFFNVNWCIETERAPVHDLFARNNYRQLVSCCTIDNKTCIDHVYTNLPATQVNLLILGTFFLITELSVLWSALFKRTIK